ncbi:MAG TPA: alpha/beta hydrolase family protein [Thermomicrobiales bacterium]|nr:alpha/beta hydrolase family protein [Thermomicrobiales bacterium]
MDLARMEFFSRALGKRASYNVLLPETGEGPFPVLFQLHGLTDDCNTWIQRSNIALHANAYPMVIVFPDGGTSAYLNWKAAGRLGRQNYEDLIIIDISDHVRRHLHVTDGPWAIGGFSMGGWGAMWLGLKYPDRFASIWSHSSKFNWRDSDLDFSMLAQPEDVDLPAYAERISMLEQKPIISFDCGVDDQLIEENRDFHNHLEKIGLEHHYSEHPGGHTWVYWDDHVREALAQHARVLGLTMSGSA